jgi:predicted 2-oxoglutarate/Fe(II)-dependent dioxygenase YbiX
MSQPDPPVAAPTLAAEGQIVGPQVYTAPAGGAVVFSCSLLHEATPVTKGKRYAFLPFLYDDAAAKVRDENLKYVELNPQPQPPAG